MTKELFTEALEAIKKQADYDILVAEHLACVFPDVEAANLFPVNHLLGNMLLKVLQTEMDDLTVDRYGLSWIEYFCHELNFGTVERIVTLYEKPVPLTNAGELYDFLIILSNNRKNKKQ
jgi:hypothetical protein